jgi:hypothetical protein
LVISIENWMKNVMCALMTGRHAIRGRGTRFSGGNAATENGITTPQADYDAGFTPMS